MAVVRKFCDCKAEPINNTVNGGYTYLLHFRCNHCRQFNILQFKGAGEYKCRHCSKPFYIRRER